MKIKINDSEKAVYKYLIEDGNMVIIFQDISLDELKLYFENTKDVKIYSEDIPIKELSEYKLLSVQIEDMITVKLSPIDIEKVEMKQKIDTLEQSNDFLIDCLLEMSEIVYKNEDETDDSDEDKNEDENLTENDKEPEENTSFDSTEGGE